MKIKEFTIKNFKSFGNYTTPVTGKLSELKSMNMIYGDNNSGKSNILKFVELIFKRKIVSESPLLVEGKEQITKHNLGPFWKGAISNEPFIFHKNQRNYDISFDFTIEVNIEEINSFARYAELAIEYPNAGGNTSSFTFTGIIKNLNDPFASEMILNAATLNGKEIYFDDGAEKHYFRSGDATQALLSDSISFENLFGIFNDKVLFLDTDRFLTNEKANNSIKSLTPKTFKNWLHNLSLNPIEYKKFENFIQFIIGKNISHRIFRNFELTFSRNEEKEIDVMLNNGSERLPLSSYGTGIHQAIYILALLFETKAKIILIEELELNLSPKFQRELFKIFRTLISEGIIDQVLFTTHSPYFAFVTDFSVYEVSMNIQGVSTVAKSGGKRKSFFAKRGLD